MQVVKKDVGGSGQSTPPGTGPKLQGGLRPAAQFQDRQCALLFSPVAFPTSVPRCTLNGRLQGYIADLWTPAGSAVWP